MTLALWSLLAYAVWTLTLMLGVFLARTQGVVTQTARITDFPADVPHGSNVYRRMTRAHLNCVENLPVFGAVVLVGDQGGLVHPAIDTLAILVVAFRVAQSVAHISSGSGRVIMLRATFFAIQVLCILGMVGTEIGLWVTRR